MKTTHAISGLSAAVALALSAGTVSAEDVLQTETVHVTASRVEQELMDVPMSVSVVTQEDIEQSSGKTIADFLDDIPGVEVQNDGSQGLKRIQVRGESPFRTVVMIDGQKISEHKSMSGTPILVDPSMVERIEVIKGPASVLYGSDAIGGAVNIITKKGGNKPVQASVSAGYDSSGNGRSTSGSIFGAAAGWEYRISGAVEKYDDLDTPIGKVENTDFSSRSGSAYLAYNVNENIKIGGSLDTFDLESYSADQIGVLKGSMRGFAVDVPEWKRTKGALFYEQNNISDNFVRLRIDGFVQQTDKNMHNYVNPNSGPTTNVIVDNWADNELKQTALSVQTDWQFGDSYYIVGYEYSHETLDAMTHQIMTVNTVRPFMSVNVLSNGTEWYDAEQDRHALYLSGETPVLDTVTLNYGVRYTWIDGSNTTEGSSTNTTTITRPGSQPSTQTETTPSDSHNSASDGKAVFNFGVLWRPITELSLRASWAQGYRFPLMQEMFIDSVMGGEYTYANPDLKPETSDNFEIGARWDGRLMSVDAAVFYNMTDDYITSVSIGKHSDGTAMSQMQNVAEATTYGLEMGVDMKPLAFGVAPYTSFTIMRRKYEENGISTYDSGTPEFTARYGVKWTDEYDGLKLRGDFFALTRTETDEHNMDADNPSTSHFGGATTFNLTGGVSFGPQDAYSLDVGLYNLTDKLYTKAGSTYEAGRFFTVKLNAKF